MDIHRTILALAVGLSGTAVAVGLFWNHRSTSARLQEVERKLTEVADRKDATPRPTELLVDYIRAQHAEVRHREMDEAPRDFTTSRLEGTDQRMRGRERERSRPNQGPVEDFAPFREVLEAEFVADRADPTWALEAKRLVHDGLLQHIPDGSEIRGIDCRSQMCRVESTHMSRDSANSLIAVALLDPEKRPWNGSFSTGLVREDEVGGPVTMVTYLMREGQELPDAPSDAEDDWN